MRLSQITSIGWCANMMLDRKEQPSFTIDDIYTAVDEGGLVDLLMKTIDDSGLIEACAQRPEQKAELENALSNAAEALRGRELRKAGVGENALCLVMAIVLEAIQQNFSR